MLQDDVWGPKKSKPWESGFDQVKVEEYDGKTVTTIDSGKFLKNLWDD